MGKGKALECCRGGSLPLVPEVTAHAPRCFNVTLTVHILLFTTSIVVLLLLLLC